MRSWMPNAQMTRAKVRQMREAGMEPEMIGFRIGWDWGQARILDKHYQMMLEQAMLHEDEKKAMVQAFTAQMAMVRAARAGMDRALPGMLIGIFLMGFVLGGVMI